MCHSCGSDMTDPCAKKATYRQMSCVRCGRLMRNWRHSTYCDTCRRGLGHISPAAQCLSRPHDLEERIARLAARAAGNLPLFEDATP